MRRITGLFDEDAGNFRPIYRNRNRAVYSRAASQDRSVRKKLEDQAQICGVHSDLKPANIFKQGDMPL